MSSWDAPLAELGADPTAAAWPDSAPPHFFWECFACTVPWAVLVALNGVDERLDQHGDDCHGGSDADPFRRRHCRPPYTRRIGV
jgi:hypothetical protein